MNLESMLLIGMLLGNNVATDIEYYEGVYTEDYEQKQEKMYISQVEKNPEDINALTELANYYEELNTWTLENFNKAEAVYKEIIEINPKSTLLAKFYLDAESRTYYYIDENDEKIDFYKKAEDECLRLLEIDSNSIEILTDLGNLYSDNYHYSYYYDDTDDLAYFDCAEKTYLKILSIDENNTDAIYELIDLYRDEWRFDDNFTDTENDEIFDKIEHQYLDILSIDEDSIQARYDLINFYETSYSDKDIDCLDKIEQQFVEMSKLETKDDYYVYIPIDIGDMFKNIWYDSEYTDNDTFDKSEYYYKYALNIEPDNDIALDYLNNLYKDAYYYGNQNNEDYFKNAEQLYKYRLTIPNTYYYENLYFDLGCLYEQKWLNDKSDYTYYYMAENEFYNALDFELESNSKSSIFETLDYYMALADLYVAKYDFDGDLEPLNKGKNLILEEISTMYDDEILYMDSENQDSYVNKQKLTELGTLYGYLWRLDTNDIQYYEKAEKTFLKSLEFENDYWLLFKLGELYTDRWLLDKSDVEYKLKAIECFDEVLSDDDELSYSSWLEEDIYPLLEKLEL